MITFVVLHQYSPAGSSSWDSWTSVGTQKSFSHCYSTVTASVVDCLDYNMQGKHAVLVRRRRGGYLQGITPIQYGWVLSWDSWTSAGTSWLLGLSFALLSHSVLLLWTAWFSVEELLRLFCIISCMSTNLHVYHVTLCVCIHGLCVLVPLEGLIE